MRSFSLTFIFIFYVVLSCAQNVPFGFNYQGVASDNNNNPYKDKNISLELSIINDVVGNIVYKEIHQNIKTSELGIFSVIIGRGTTLDKLSDIDWGATTFSLRTKIDPNGGDSFTEVGRSSLLAVPYALYALKTAQGTVPGPKGEKGDKGEIGAQGPSGAQGQQGLVGVKGDKGDSGVKGDKGEIGAQGPSGAQGQQGLAGVKGDKGDPGVKGDKGDPGNLTGNAGGDLTGTYPNPIVGDNKITSSKLADNSVTSSKIINGTIVGVDIAGMGATNGQALVWNGSVWTPTTVANGSPTGSAGGDLTGTYPNPSITANAVTTVKLIDNAVTTNKIVNGAITTTKLSDNAVTTDKIANGTIIGVDLAQMGATNGQALVWNGSVWTPTTSVNSLWELSNDLITTSDFRNVALNGNNRTLQIGNNQSTPDIIMGGAGFGTSSGVLPYFRMRYNNQTRVNFVARSNYGLGVLRGPSSDNVSFSVRNSDENKGFVSVGDGNSFDISRLTINDNGAGYCGVYGPNQKLNAVMSHSSASANHGMIGVYDDLGVTPRAGMYVDEFGDGIIYGAMKYFRMQDPSDESKSIWYASLEGPEAGAYERGVAALKNGEAFISYSDHFLKVINPNTVTIILTPQSIETYGLAVVEKRKDGFVVKELMHGKGTFSFDWEVKGVRQGYEDYQVVRDNDVNLSRKAQSVNSAKASMPDKID